ncbi:MAG TPA: TonB-dependent receptor, partial [Polyangiaceae bacterium]|nr:TonB-dependent receptor [Polyangiaceae bacterium]
GAVPAPAPPPGALPQPGAAPPGGPAQPGAPGQGAPAQPGAPTPDAGPAAPPGAAPDAGQGPAPSADPSAPPPEGAGAPDAGAPAEPALAAPPDAPPPPPPAPDEVTVAGTRLARTAGSAHVIKRKQLERFEYDDAHQVLLGVPGVYVRGEDGFGLRPNIGIRGATSDRSKKVTLMEDGVLFAPAPYSAPAAYYFPIMTRMTGVRVIKGPSAISYGPQTVGGAIDLITRPIPSSSQGTVDLGFGQYGYRKAHASYGASDEQSGFLLEGVHLANDGFKELDVVGGDTGFVRNEWMAKGSHVLDPRAAVRHEFSVKLGYSDERSNETYLGLSDADFKQNPYRRYVASRLDRMQWKRTQVQLSHKVDFSSRFSVTTTAYRHDLERVWYRVNGFPGKSIAQVLADPEDPSNASLYEALRGGLDVSVLEPSAQGPLTLLVARNARTFVSQGVQSVARYELRTGPVAQRLEYGIRLHNDSIERRHTQDGYLMRGDGELVGTGYAPAVTADNRESTVALALHAVDAIEWGRLTLTPGVRVELIQSRSRQRPGAPTALDARPPAPGVVYGAAHQVVLPGAGAYLALTREIGALAGVYRGFTPPAPGSLQKPEDSINYEAGLRYSRARARAEVIGFYNDYKKLVEICTTSTGCPDIYLDTQVSAGKARIYGFEAFAEIEPRLPFGLTLPARASYTLTRTELLNDAPAPVAILGDYRRGDELPYVPRHQVSASAGVESARWGLNLAATYVSPMREIAGQGPAPPGGETDDYFLLDASGSFKVIKGISVYVNGRNLLDSEYIVARRPFGARPGAPRWAQAGVKAEF